MAEYIEREALMRNLKHFAPEQLTPLIESLIQKQPAADVAEVRHGEWIYGEFDIPQCSECGKEVLPNQISKHCPDCGAKMDGRR